MIKNEANEREEAREELRRIIRQSATAEYRRRYVVEHRPLYAAVLFVMRIVRRAVGWFK